METVRLPPLDLFINNEFTPSIRGKRFSVIQPATEQSICAVAEADKDDVDKAVKAALEAQVARHLSLCVERVYISFICIF